MMLIGWRLVPREFPQPMSRGAEKLSRFQLGQVDMSGTFHGGNLDVALTLLSVALDDVRANSKLAVKR